MGGKSLQRALIHGIRSLIEDCAGPRQGVVIVKSL